MPDGNTTIIIQGKKKFEIEELLTKSPYLTAKVRDTNEVRPEAKNEEFLAIVEAIKELALKIIKDNPNIPTEATFAIQNIQSNSFLINFVSSNLSAYSLAISDAAKLISLTLFSLLCNFKRQLEPPKEFVRIS